MDAAAARLAVIRSSSPLASSSPSHSHSQTASPAFLASVRSRLPSPASTPAPVCLQTPSPSPHSPHQHRLQHAPLQEGSSPVQRGSSQIKRLFVSHARGRVLDGQLATATSTAGHCLHMDVRLLMADGTSRAAGDIQLGDWVLDERGQRVQVTAVQRAYLLVAPPANAVAPHQIVGAGIAALPPQGHVQLPVRRLQPRSTQPRDASSPRRHR